MKMENNDLLLKKIKSISKSKDINNLKINLYGLCSFIILSKELFERNKDIKPFMNSINFDFKDYVYLSRSLLASRVIRKIEKKNLEDLHLLKEDIEAFFNERYSVKQSVENEINKNRKKDESYVLNLVDKYKRR